MSWDIHFDGTHYRIFSTVTMNYISPRMTENEMWNALNRTPNYYSRNITRAEGQELIRHSMRLAKEYGTDEARPNPPEYVGNKHIAPKDWPQWVKDGIHLHNIIQGLTPKNTNGEGI